MRKGKMLIFLLIFGLLTSGWMAAPASAETEPTAEQEPVEIRTVEQLQNIAEDPAGSYVLMEDLDLTGVDWEPIDFSGSLDGNGHAILNLELARPGSSVADTYDGNLKVYSSEFVGLFGKLRGARVTNLKLLGVSALVDTDESCFVGALAGFSSGSTITGCTVSGTLELRAHKKMFGIGGLVGYGGGYVRDCDVDVTLICTDTDKTTRDEQFLGGILGMGFMDIEECTVTIDGYISDYGYVHSGGLIGMLLRYPIGDWTCRIAGNYVNGKITFFECNWDRRAYCDPFVGEYMTSYRTVEDNTSDFTADERFEYDVELRPEMCQTPEYQQTAVDGTCYDYGYTSHVCQNCGYTYRDGYTGLLHKPETWTVTREATTEQEGLKTGYCACGLEVAQDTIPKLEPEPTQPPTEATAEPETLAPETQPTEPAPTVSEGGTVLVVLCIAALVAGAVIAVILVSKGSRSGRYLK